MSVAVLCRGSLAEGLGHITRAAAVTAALGNRASPFVVIGDDAAAAVAREHAADPKVVESEANALLELGIDFEALVLDVATLERASFDTLKAIAPTFSLSPRFEFQEEVTRSYSRTTHEPDESLAADPNRHRRGIEYTIVGQHVRPVMSSDYVATAFHNPMSVGIAMGGSDATNLTMRAIEVLGTIDERLLIWAMLGEGYAHSYDALVDTIRQTGRHEALLAKASHSMWTVLARTAVVVLAGGVTSYEAAYARVPAVNLTSESNRYLVEELSSAGVALTLVGDDAWGDLPDVVSRLAEDRDELFAMHRRSQDLIDGHGAVRVANDIETMLAQ